ncbi:phosphoadenosine phosphosulfate reductase family protein [uncultured Dokdonia sp.]|uniref:phosphoadenosine phosphosulfate reductase domain-containing protein n=1 Tax=uncultured Dokdonia sp. TaxID=575653 RepID=UPI002618654D|nr:phosphoadenosine phosphosulfate reductase family protein [uncultured Dokdonia sp.]
MITTEELLKINKELRQKTPLEICKWAVAYGKNPIVTTNFRPYEAAILFACVNASPKIPVVWCDSGYNTPATYAHAENLIEKLQLNVHLYVPKQTVAHRAVTIGIPDIDDPKHTLFTEQVKLEPFKRAMGKLQPDVWFTNLRKGQTALRNTLDILSQDKNGMLKVSPFYYYSDTELDVYLEENALPNEFDYFDPTKVLEHRECGLHSN